MNLAGNCPVPHAQHRLAEARDPRRFERMADVRLHAADRQLAIARQLVLKRQIERPEFRGIADLGRGGVTLDVLQPRRIDPAAIRAMDRENLAFLTRRPQAFAAPVRRYADAANDSLNRVPVLQRPRQGLQDHRGVPIGADQPVGARVEGAGTGPADRFRLREEDQRVPLAARRAADHGHVDLPMSQGVDPHRHRDQRRGAGRIGRQRGTTQPEGLGDQGGDIARADLGAAIGPPAARRPMDAVDHAAQHRLLRRGRQGAKRRVFKQIRNDGFGIVVAGHLSGEDAPSGVADVNPGMRRGDVVRIVAGVAERHRRHFAHDEVGGVGVM